MTASLVEFLRARLDEDEAAAMLAGATPEERWRRHEYAVREDVPNGGLGVWIAQGCEDEETAAHIARHDPARVLADVAAKREVIAAAAKVAALVDDEMMCCHGADELLAGASDDHLGGTDPIPPDCAGAPVLRQLLSPLAAPYASHPDYQQKWTP